MFYKYLSTLVVALAAAGAANATAFLGDTSDFYPDPAGSGAIVWGTPELDLSGYDKLLIEPVNVVLSETSDTRNIRPATLKTLTDYFHQALVDAVDDAYTVADEAGPGVLRVRVAITDIDRTALVRGGVLMVGAAAMQGEIVDGETGVRLSAIIDRQRGVAGRPALEGVSNWSDTKAAMDLWAKRLREFLDQRNAQRTPAMESASFLSLDREEFEPDPDNPGALYWAKPDLSYSSYDSILFEPATVLSGQQSAYKGIQPNELKVLAHYFEDAARRAVERHFRVVDKPGPGVLRVRAAISDLERTTLVRGGVLMKGQAAMEAEIVDSQTGEPLSAYIDKRSGLAEGQATQEGASSWADTLAAFEFWSQGLLQHLRDNELVETPVLADQLLANLPPLRPHPDGSGAELWRKPGLDLSGYDKLLIDPPVYRLSGDARGQSLQPDQLQRLVDYFHEAMQKAIQDAYPVVDQPGPGVLRVHVAINDVRSATRVRGGVVVHGAAAITAVLADAESGERLTVFRDRREGLGQAPRIEGQSSWDDTRRAFDLWAARLRERLDETRG